MADKTKKRVTKQKKVEVANGLSANEATAIRTVIPKIRLNNLNMADFENLKHIDETLGGIILEAHLEIQTLITKHNIQVGDKIPKEVGDEIEQIQALKRELPNSIKVLSKEVLNTILESSRDALSIRDFNLLHTHCMKID